MMPSSSRSSRTELMVQLVLVAAILAIGAVIFLSRSDDEPATTSPADDTYLVEAESCLERSRAATQRLSELMAAPRLGEQAWTSDVAAQTETYNAVLREEQQATVPPEHDDIHATLLEIFELLNAAGGDVTNALNNLDATGMVAAGDKFREAMAIEEDSDIGDKLSDRE